jgi:hypothetical protein
LPSGLSFALAAGRQIFAHSPPLINQTMKIRLSLLAVACALAVAPVSTTFAADKEETELSQKMDKMSGPFRALRRQIKDSAKNADSLEKLKTIKEYAQAALKLEPAQKATVPAADQAKYVAAYHAQMKEFIGLVSKVEAALKANNNAEAEKLVGAMAEAQKKGHDEFKKKEKKS